MDGFVSRDAHFQGKHLDICLFISKQGGVGLQEVVCGWPCSAGEASAVAQRRALRQSHRNSSTSAPTVCNALRNILLV